MTKKKSGNKKYSFKNLHVTSTISMSLVLFLVGLVCMLLFVARDAGIYVKENINLSVVLDDQIDSSYAKRIENYLNNTPYARSVTYISKEDALKEHIAMMGEDPQDFLGYNPLLASLEVKLNAEYANNDSVSIIETKLKTFEHINRVAYQKDMVQLVNENVRRISIILLGLAAVLLFVSMVLINNTVRLSIYSNRFLINTMKLVGATSWFIRKPYIGKGIRNGFIASLLSILLLGGMLYFIQKEFGFNGELISTTTGILVILIVMVLGIALSAISSHFAVGRYLRMKTNDMYFI